ncbi:hypothetical protein PV10_02704 [Exophiala mesophila]|uniref:Uncharacterized protein n=1 Tax=Exophiala mesophila TaxID=212818 RepID=A0A0D1WZQ8_EXOME|nr:uncharacterized protein PV10_02704 [Exophiala mesophila]KIV94995.1 hypothetical protein PV10_02704 [Exophiala mesophila]
MQVVPHDNSRLRIGLMVHCQWLKLVEIAHDTKSMGSNAEEVPSGSPDVGTLRGTRQLFLFTIRGLSQPSMLSMKRICGGRFQNGIRHRSGHLGHYQATQEVKIFKVRVCVTKG